MSATLNIPSPTSNAEWAFRLAAALRRAGLRVRAWSAARKREVADREALNTMSDRGLLDIGISRASVDELAAGRWVRDWPI